MAHPKVSAATGVAVRVRVRAWVRACVCVYEFAQSVVNNADVVFFKLNKSVEPDKLLVREPIVNIFVYYHRI